MQLRNIIIGALLAAAPFQALAQDRHEGDRRGGDRRGGDFRRGDDRRGEDRRGDWGERHDWRDHRDFGEHRWYGGDYPRFAYPQGYRYRRWGIGAVLPSVFLGGGYVFNDYPRFGFAPPPYGFRWVRNGPDLILVNVRNGRVRDVRYGVFG